jgi:microcystin degradation protein MlrC
MARIAVASFRHETNTFAPHKAAILDFETGYSWPGLKRGADMLPAIKGFNLGVAGFVARAKTLGHEIAPLVFASASPSAQVTEDAYEAIVGMIFEELAGGGPVDALFLGLHGAMVAEHLDDGEGELLQRLRQKLGPNLPIVVTLDYHANMSEASLEHATAITGYRTYPHADMAETGARMAIWLDQHLRTGAPRPTFGFRQTPFLIPLFAGCTMRDPASTIVTAVAEIEAETGVLLTFAGGFPAADIPDCGPSVYGYGEDQAVVASAVGRVADMVEAMERDWGGDVLTPDAAVAKAVKLAEGACRPVVMADIQDNPGAGGTGDTMGLIKAMSAAGLRNAAAGLVFDPHVATIAMRAGEGAVISVALGGKHDIPGDKPLAGEFTVIATSDGQMTGTGPLYKGAKLDLAPMARLRFGGIDIVVAGKRVQAADQECFRHVGIEPAAMRFLALKSSAHFRGHFQPIAEAVIDVAAPGPMAADPGALPFTRLRPGVRQSPAGARIGG